MKVFLMHPGQDFDPGQHPPPQAAALTQDLELGTLLGAMAAGDQFLFEVARTALLTGLADPAAIGYRQEVLADCLAQEAVVRELYDLAVAAIQGEKKFFFSLFSRSSPDVVLHRSVQVLGYLAGQLRSLRKTAVRHAGEFRSRGFTRLFSMLSAELSEEYLAEVDSHLKELTFRRGTLITARLGAGLTGTGHVLRRLREQSWLDRLTPDSQASYRFQIADRDENGMRALSELEGRGVNLVANALAQSTDHILSFYRVLRTELAFYLGCLNLHGALASLGQPVCFPDPLPPGRPGLTAEGLHDACLALQAGAGVAGNGLHTGGKPLVMITGANQGGKSTFLRSVGLAQVMMECGMFVPARSLRASVSSGIFTHFRREEDAAMESGKLDEELGRMSAIVDQISPGGLLLCNESFASANEREGSQIAHEIIRALLERGIRVFFVTHLFELAHRFCQEQPQTSLFLRAERQAGGRRTFRITAGEPQPTSHGEDLYRRIFRADAGPALAGPAGFAGMPPPAPASSGRTAGNPAEG